jgi:DNA-binding IclR family transcriptional regulator
MKNINQYQVRTVQRAISILKLFINKPGLMSLTEISRETGLNQVTAYRLIATFIATGFIEQSTESEKYRLGVTALALGDAYSRSNDLSQRAHPRLVELRDKCGETVHLSILDGAEIVYLDKIPGLHPIGLMSSRVGGRAPAYCTGVGKVLLAYQPEDKIRTTYLKGELISFTPRTITSVERLLVEFSKIRANGYALDQEEHEIGVACVAAPIFDHNGILAAISLSGPYDRIMNSVPELSKQAMRIAGVISTFFGDTLSSHSISLSSKD